MKRISVIFTVVELATPLLLPLLAACSQQAEEIPTNPSVTDSYESLLSELALFNANQPLVVTRNPPKQDEKELSREDVIKIMHADSKGALQGGADGAIIGGAIGGVPGAIIGAVLGGSIIGGQASYLQYKECKKENTDQPQTTTYTTNLAGMSNSIIASYIIAKNNITPHDYTLGLNNGLDSCYVTIGIQHNKILAVLDSMTYINPQSLPNGLSMLEQSIINSNEFKMAFTEITKNPFENYNYLSTNGERIVNLFIQGVYDSCISQKDVDKFVAYYTTATKHSTTINEKEKQNLYTFFAVAAYSYNYWIKYSNVDNDDEIIL